MGNGFASGGWSMGKRSRPGTACSVASMSDFVPTEHAFARNANRSLESTPRLSHLVPGNVHVDSRGSTPRLSHFIPAKPFSPFGRSTSSTPRLSCFLPNGTQSDSAGNLKPFPECSNGFKPFREKSGAEDHSPKLGLDTKDDDDDDLGHMIPDHPIMRAMSW